MSYAKAANLNVELVILEAIQSVKCCEHLLSFLIVWSMQKHQSH